MKIIYWNIQGAKKPQPEGEIRYLKSKHNPDIIIIAKTMVSQETRKRLRRN